MSSSRTWDVVVIGAGPAGALSAFLAARAGMSTLLVERKPFPRTKVCGTCLNRSAVELLQSLGLGEITSSSGVPIQQLELGFRGRRLRLSLPEGVAIPRTILDSELVRHAEAAGAAFRPETSATLGDETGSARAVRLRTRGVEEVVHGRVVVVAAGLGNSALRDSDSFSTHVSRRARLGAGCLVETHAATYAEGQISMAIGRSGYVGLTSTMEGLAIALAVDPEFLKRCGGPAHAGATIIEEAGFPPVPAMLSAEWSGTLPLTRSTRPVASSRVFLVGDSAGYVEPFTGQGMAIALHGALALAPHVARAVEAWSPDVANAWSREYPHKVGSTHWPAALVAAIARRPRLTRLVFALAGAVPTVPNALVRAVNRPDLTHSST